MEPRRFLGRTWIEWAILFAVILIIARVYWAAELSAAEDRFLQRIGIEPALKLLVTVPLAFYLFWRRFKREQAAASQAGWPTVRKSVIAACGLLLLLAIGFVCLLRNLQRVVDFDS